MQRLHRETKVYRTLSDARGQLAGCYRKREICMDAKWAKDTQDLGIISPDSTAQLISIFDGVG